MKKQQQVIAPQPGKQEMALNLKVDVLIYGGSAGSGKSRLLLMKPLLYISDPNFNCVFFRRTTKALEKAGSLWPECKKLYSNFKPRFREQAHQAIFKSGAIVSMDHLEHEKDAEGNHQGTQYSGVHFDELTHFSQTQFLYLLGRMRSDSASDSYCMATTNPDPDSWVLNWVDWYLKEDGYPDEEKCGRVRYFVTVGDKPVFADTQEELAEEYPDICYQLDPLNDEMIYVPPLSFAFVNGTIFDNPALIRANPKYLASLKSQTAVNRARLLDGNWYARPEESGYFKREWLIKADNVPLKAKVVRAWDKAATEPSDVNKYPDYTASVQMYKDREGFYYIAGNYHPNNFDKTDPDTKGRFRRRAGERDRIILEQALYDGDQCYQVFPQDPGASGVTEFQESAKKLIEEGIVVKKDPVASNRSKLTRFIPFASACENQMVYIIENSFDKKTLEHFYKECESFNGERSSSNRKDDLPDSVASAFNYLSKQKVLPAFTLTPNNSTNNMASFKQTVFSTK